MLQIVDPLARKAQLSSDTCLISASHISRSNMQFTRLRSIVSTLQARLVSTQASPPVSTRLGQTAPEITRRRLRDRFCTGPYEIPGRPRPVYPKRKSPFKRAGALINALHQEEGLRLIAEGRAIFPKKIPNPRSGDVIRIKYVHSLSNMNMQLYFTGICIAVKRRGLGSTFVLRNVVEGIPIERGFPIYSPLIQDAEIIGRKDVRKMKLYYLRDKPLRESTVPNATKAPKPRTG